MVTKEKGRMAKETDIRAGFFESLWHCYPRICAFKGQPCLSALAGAGGDTGQNIRKLKWLKGKESFALGSMISPSCLQMHDKEWIYNELLLSKK